MSQYEQVTPYFNLKIEKYFNIISNSGLIFIIAYKIVGCGANVFS